MSKPTLHARAPRKNDLLPSSDAEFIQTLSERQRAYFLRRESERQAQLQEALRCLARSLSAINDLNGRVVHVIARTAR